jgi:asparagine synthase (glutamine-hydrolysing)
VLNEQKINSTAFLLYDPFLLPDKTIPFDLKPVGGSELDQYLYHLLFNTRLPALLHYGDRISMAYSIECRVPFLDHRLVEFVFSLDDRDKITDGQTKYILRRSLENILPKAISDRKVKQPFFGDEMNKWLRGPLRHLLEADFEGLTIHHN